jgi:hypothetical protein
MKHCAAARLLVSRYLDSDLPESDLPELKTHLEHCAKCRATLENYASIKELLSASYSEKSLPPTIVRSLLGSTAAIGGTARFPVTWRLAAPAAIVALVVLSMVLLPQFRQPASTRPSYVLESNGQSIMDLPLGSFVYYENLTGSCVHSQFVRFSSPAEEEQNSKIALLAAIPSYESPFFNDRAMISGKGVPSYE